jgi:hypothetical protein
MEKTAVIVKRAELNKSLISSSQEKSLCYPLIHIVRDYFSDPKHKAQYQKWEKSNLEKAV